MLKVASYIFMMFGIVLVYDNSVTDGLLAILIAVVIRIESVLEQSQEKE